MNNVTLRCAKYITQFSQLLPHFPVKGRWRTPPGVVTNLAAIIKRDRCKNILTYFGQAASVVSRERIRFHLIQGKQAIDLFSQLNALQKDPFSIDEWTQLLAQPNAVLITAFGAKNPVGFVVGHQAVSLGDVYIIDELVFDQEYQSRGIGSWLLKAVGFLAFEMNLRQLIGFVEGKNVLAPNIQEFLRGAGAEEISGGVDGGHYLRLDLTAPCLVPLHMSNEVLLGRTTQRIEAWLEEAIDPSWHRRMKTAGLPEEIKNERGGLGEEVMNRSQKVNEPKTLAELLKGLDWKDVPLILPHKRSLTPAQMRKHPLMAAVFDVPFRARFEVVPFIYETYLFRYIAANFGEVSVEANEDCFILTSKGQRIGTIKAGPKNGIFELSYRGRIHPDGKTTSLIAIGNRRIDQSLIDLGDLYYLMNICYHYQHFEARFGEQTPKLTQIFYVSLREREAARALLAILFALNLLQEAEHINNFINALIKAAESDWPFYSFWKLTETMILEEAGWDKINLACKYILKFNDFEDPMHKQVSVWSKEGDSPPAQDAIYKEIFGPINVAILQMVQAGASAQDLDQLFVAAVTSPNAGPAFDLFFVAADLFEKAGASRFQELIDCFKQSSIFEKYPKKESERNSRNFLAMAAVNLLTENEKSAIKSLFSVYEADSELGIQIAQIAIESLVGAKFVAALVPEMELAKDRRIREKLAQVLWAVPPLLQNGKAAQLVESLDRQAADNVYVWLDQLFNLLQFSRTQEDAQIFISGGIEALKENVFRQAQQRFGFEANLAAWPAYSSEGFVRSANQLLQDKRRPDPNIAFLFRKSAEHGSMQQFYRLDQRAQQTIAALASEGYDVEHFVFGQPLLMQAQGISGSVADLYSIWLEIAQVIKLLFDEEFSAAFLAAIQQMKDTRQAKPLTFKYIKMLREKMAAITSVSGKAYRRKEELKDLLNGVEWQAQYGVYIEGGKIESRKSIKAIPEVLFDNRRLACCVFYPNGDVRNEIPLVAMDPQTPIVEFWVSELDEFAGLAIEYAGKNREILLDTFEFSQSLTAVLGGDPTFRFVTDSLVLDAYRSGARRLLVYNCDYGHPLRYVRYLRNIVKKEAYQGIVNFEPKYRFELADPQNHALRNSKNGINIHYTDAFRSKSYRRRPMKGRIPVFVIDVAAYYAAFKERIEAGITT